MSTMKTTAWRNAGQAPCRVPILEERDGRSVDASVPCEPGEVCLIPSMYDHVVPRLAPQLVRVDEEDPAPAKPEPPKREHRAIKTST